ncbi:MAG: polymer-forming cytoskeletal protein [Chloroflexi bacterium]|nr:polymer-forming cytoskeletal protein [Chloroflexota bacterium]
MSFFKKKRFSEVEGYERISRLIEDRQRELGGDEVEDDGLDEDTVLLQPQVRNPREPLAEAPTSRRPSDTFLAQPLAQPPDAAGRMEQAPFQAIAPETAPPPAPQSQFAPPQVAPMAPPRMAVPDLPALSGKAVSLVSKDAVWDGKLSCTGDVRVEGRLEGEVETNGTLFVAAEARVQGIVRARSVMLAGEIEGQLRCEERLEILPGGSARGEIDTGALVVHEGAFIESKFQMRREAAPAHA